MNQLDSKLVGLANGFAAGKGIHRKVSAAVEIQGEPGSIGVRYGHGCLQKSAEN